MEDELLLDYDFEYDRQFLEISKHLRLGHNTFPSMLITNLLRDQVKLKVDLAAEGYLMESLSQELRPNGNVTLILIKKD